MEGYRVYPSLPRTLGDDPFQTGDYSQKDATLRTPHVKVIGDHAVTWWVAHPDKSVMVVDIRPADK